MDHVYPQPEDTIYYLGHSLYEILTSEVGLFLHKNIINIDFMANLIFIYFAAL